MALLFLCILWGTFRSYAYFGVRFVPMHILGYVSFLCIFWGTFRSYAYFGVRFVPMHILGYVPNPDEPGIGAVSNSKEL